MTDDITSYTYADVFSSVGKQTDVIARFSVVTGPSGSPEWLRDPRGFAIKFYTSMGNWDLVRRLAMLLLPCHVDSSGKQPCTEKSHACGHLRCLYICTSDMSGAPLSTP